MTPRRVILAPRSRATGAEAKKASRSQSLERGLDILETIAGESGEVGVRELARRLGLSPTIVQRLVTSLAGRGYTEKDADTQRYRLGHRAGARRQRRGRFRLPRGGAPRARAAGTPAPAERLRVGAARRPRHLSPGGAGRRPGGDQGQPGQRNAAAQHQRRQGAAGGAVRRRGAQDPGQPQASRPHAAQHHRPRRADRLARQSAPPGLCLGQRGEHSGRAVGGCADPRPQRRSGRGAERGLSQVSRFGADACQRRASGERGGAAHLAAAWHAACNGVEWTHGECVRRDMMNKTIWLAAVAAGALLTQPVLAQQPIVIGVSTPQTGVAAVASEWEMWGANLAVEEINQAGGLLGRKVELMVLDNKCNPSEAVNVANKLVEAKVVAVEGAHCSSAHLASMKIMADAKIPIVTGIASNPQITALAGPGRNEYSFRISPSDSAMMDALGIYLGNKKVFKTVAIVGEDTDFGRGGADAFKAVADKAGVTVVSTDFHPQNAPDFTSILTRLQQRRPDAIATFQVGGDSINFLRQAMQFGVRIPYTGRIELGGRNQPIIEAGGMEKSISAWTYNATIDAPENKAFVAKIRAKHNSEPYLQTWGAYDSIRVIAQAIKQAGSTDGEKIKDAIKKLKFTTVIGKTVTFDDHNSAGRFVVLQTVVDKKVGVADIVEVK